MTVNLLHLNDILYCSVLAKASKVTWSAPVSTLWKGVCKGEPGHCTSMSITGHEAADGVAGA